MNLADETDRCPAQEEFSANTPAWCVRVGMDLSEVMDDPAPRQHVGSFKKL